MPIIIADYDGQKEYHEVAAREATQKMYELACVMAKINGDDAPSLADVEKQRSPHCHACEGKATRPMG